MDIESLLNESQQEAVTYCDGPELVIAGAGSGKTRVLTYKIAYLLEHGYKPWNILALTFTNKAASEMKERIAGIVGNETAKYLQMGTFHSIFSRILRAEASLIGYDSNYTIYDETDARSLTKNIIKLMGLDDKTYKPATVHGIISMAKNHLITAEDYAIDRSAQERDGDRRMPEISRIYQAYQARLVQANAMDFDDLLVNAYTLFRDHDDVRRKYAERFTYVLVDEYQDTNYAQQCIVLQLAAEHRHLCVVGDDNQSIYSFRGANIDNILDFQEKLGNVKLVKLERNYRSTQNIVRAASSLIKHNKRQIEKEVYSEEAEGERVRYRQAQSDKEEAYIVCNEIKKIKKADSCSYSDFAILYRTNAQSRSFEEQLRKEDIPYRIYGGLSFYQRKEIKDIIAYFRMVVNPNDEEAFRRIINYPARGIGNTTIQKIVDCAQADNISLWEVITNPEEHRLGVNKGALTKLVDFRSMIDGFIADSLTKDASELAMRIVKETGITADLYSSTNPDDIARQENMDEFMGGVKDFVDMAREEDRSDHIFLADFLQEVSLMTDLDSGGDDDDQVTLMTVHAAKGLEFPTVFVVGLEEDLFPSSMAKESKRQQEEERRLFYVAITRAEKHCILTSAKSRYRYGKLEFANQSRFINEIEPKYLNVEDCIPESSYGNSRYGGYGRKPWEEDYQPNRAYTGSHPWGQEYRQMSSRMQNSNPVASQFRADPKPKLTERKQPERAVDPLSGRTKRRLVAEGGNFRRISSAIANGGRSISDSVSTVDQLETSGGTLHEGTVIEHQRFGTGTVIKLEGQGENAKATVEFRNAGTKQLLLKFARFTIIR